ncbi:hypothetical protein LRP79_00140 [Burkholderia pseudomallei]|uniref:hypothetical protein n=1 Tax=Burkholderia pseudomallei TaxID=28450 RepID=UPI000F082FC8|nr:hypothetical protein [Burkholderia pseudomallei]MBF4067512.1 hypothetical protein [Burkholderia pseudomallei]MCD4542578.1 hypothetical protein [Burkholderia pseudomallei]VBD50492.1 Uncharacterised protein [Burkholderia pseudomallei]
MDKTQLDALLAGKLEIPFAQCTLTQRGTSTPIVYEGAGLLMQDADRNLRLRLLVQYVPAHEAIQRHLFRPFVPGVIVPEPEYYDLVATDLTGTEWVAERLSLSTNFGTAGTYMEATPWHIDKREKVQRVPEASAIQAFLRDDIPLPWHVFTRQGEFGGRMDVFSSDVAGLSWHVRKKDDGVELTFTAKHGPLQRHIERFLRAFSILVGRDIRPMVAVMTDGDLRVTRLQGRHLASEKAQMVTPLKLDTPLADARDAHAFLACCMTDSIDADRDSADHSELMYRSWHRILRASKGDIENSSLVLSVAIEGMIKAAFLCDHDADDDFQAQVAEARPRLKAVELPDRVRQCVQSSLGNAVRPRVQDVLKRLIKQGAISQVHLDAWKGLRHAAAHGELFLADSDPAMQAHLNRFHCCLDLFYRLVFVIVRYRGKHVDLSSPGWPEAPFPPVVPSGVHLAGSQSAISVAAPEGGLGMSDQPPRLELGT